MTHIDTTCVQGGYQPGNGESRTPPIIQATTFKYRSISRHHSFGESSSPLAFSSCRYRPPR